MVNRRKFLKVSALGAVATAAGGCRPRPEEEIASRTLPQVFALEESTVADLQARMESGELSAHRITELYLERIEQLNHQGPELNAVIATNPDAESIAEGARQGTRTKCDPRTVARDSCSHQRQH